MAKKNNRPSAVARRINGVMIPADVSNKMIDVQANDGANLTTMGENILNDRKIYGSLEDAVKAAGNSNKQKLYTNEYGEVFAYQKGKISAKADIDKYIKSLQEEEGENQGLNNAKDKAVTQVKDIAKKIQDSENSNQEKDIENSISDLLKKREDAFSAFENFEKKRDTQKNIDDANNKVLSAAYKARNAEFTAKRSTAPSNEEYLQAFKDYNDAVNAANIEGFNAIDPLSDIKNTKDVEATLSKKTNKVEDKDMQKKVFSEYQKQVSGGKPDNYFGMNAYLFNQAVPTMKGNVEDETVQESRILKGYNKENAKAVDVPLYNTSQDIALGSNVESVQGKMKKIEADKSDNTSASESDKTKATNQEDKNIEISPSKNISQNTNTVTATPFIPNLAGGGVINPQNSNQTTQQQLPASQFKYMTGIKIK